MLGEGKKRAPWPWPFGNALGQGAARHLFWYRRLIHHLLLLRRELINNCRRVSRLRANGRSSCLDHHSEDC